MKTTKQCRTCNKIKLLSNFYKESAKKDGYKTQCKHCTKRSNKDYHASYYQDNKERIKSNAKTYSENEKHEKYGTWAAMKTRCTNSNHESYHRYGGRGINVSKELNDFNRWLDYVSSLENYGVDNFTLDRIDNDKDYAKGNLRWIGKEIQSANRVVISKANTSGYKGVFKDRGKYRARIMHGGRTVSILCGKSSKECALAYDKYVIDNNLPHTKNF